MKRVIDLVKKCEAMTVATSWNDKPRASVVEPHVLGENAIIFATSSQSIKANNLKYNKRISISVVQMPVFATIDGTVTTPSKHEIEEFDRIFYEKHPEFREMIDHGMLQDFAYYKVVIETAYYSDYTNGMVDPEIIHV
jgi:uncharacterized pyridoxamine 5'-phosphate oxidase family protein